MNILVTGANGQLGNEMRILAQGSADRYFFSDICPVSEESLAMLRLLAGEGVDTSTVLLDICDLPAVERFVAENGIQAIVNCAAYTNVDAAETNYELAERLNADAPRNLALAMQKAQGLLVHISTDYVFGQEPYNTPCREDQQGTPTGVYGQTKLHGEQYIIEVSRARGFSYLILRTAWLYSEFGKNFCKTMLRLLSTKPELKVVYDQAGTPTYALDLAKAIEVALHSYAKDAAAFPSGIYHFSNEGVCSWYDFAQTIQRIAYPSEPACSVQPCRSSEFPSPVVRPFYSVLDKSKAKKTFGIEVPYWTDSLRDCIRHLLQ